jgi:hypothetical protein
MFTLPPRPCVAKKRSDTVGELKSAEIYVFHMPSLKQKSVGNLRNKKYF